MDFYRALCDGLGVEPANNKVTIFKQIQESIFNYATNKNITPIIILDEAQFLKNSVLDDLRIIFNFQMDSKDLAIIVLAGQTNFINQINRSNHEALRQRISVNYHLEGLGYSMTNGHPREINSICRMCLISAASKENKFITKEDIFNAHKEVSIISN